ncbi:hypothetical protein [Mycolicibacterium arseniciresistens]|uniref:Uncharacterized protein n=1 Tax=Mycolicibacterium arseniciresistens TaxID=3062257 RepID=A0ABT8UE08_9MYCO|nr:hypothetical protein [Mycolicibacterium arseniciresistens]MDO3636008.1 hypothetical protein [Mycolicibacterium arseniciresistens]
MPNITEHDLRRGERFCIALYENNPQIQQLVAVEVGRENRWREHAMACALIARIALTRDTDDLGEGEGAVALWLHAAVEQLIGDGILDPRNRR